MADRTWLSSNIYSRRSIPILVLIENGTKQDIFSVLKAGAYDYLEKEDLQQYRKKIEEMILWGWYLKKYSVKKLQ